MTSAAVAGVFVGGASRRMGGHPKGLLVAPEGGRVVERCFSVLRAASVSNIVLVGARAEYLSLGLAVIEDQPAGIGPLGGLLALLTYAGQAPCLALACDMPYVSTALVRRLLTAAPFAPIVACRRESRWEPLCARYDARILPLAERGLTSGDHSLQRLLDAAGAFELGLDPGEGSALDDWDSPEDVPGGT